MIHRFAAALLLLAVCSVYSEDNQGRDDTSMIENRKILLGLYSATDGLEWTQSDNWFVQNSNVCEWFGVTCYADNESDQRKVGHIREINLKDNHLVGTVPANVFEIPYLERLNLDDNDALDIDFSGLNKAQFLTHLSISNTQVSSIAGISNAEKLEVLHITGLGLTGPFPEEITQMTSLLGLFANYNSFTGNLPASIGKMTLLDEMYLYDNDLTGSIPTEIGQLTFLEILALGQNGFAGTLPTELNLMTNLQYLTIQREAENLKGPGITGNIPPFDNHRKLTQLNLENQRLNGELDKNFLLHCPAGDQVEVDLSSNELTGALRDTLLDKTYLTLFLANNKIDLISENIYDYFDNRCPNIGTWMGGDVGDIGCNAFLCPPGTWAPEGRATQTDACEACNDNDDLWGKTSCDSASAAGSNERQVLVSLYNVMGGRNWKTDNNWLSLDVDICQWTGIDCTTDGKVSSIILRNNGLTGAFPEDVFSFPELKTLNLQSNSIDFSFKGISNAKKLEVLDLSSTNLSSSALNSMEELSSLPNLRFLSIASNDLTGAVPEDVYSLESLEELTISHNSFTGKVSTQIGGLNNLKKFDCTGNNLTGQFPTQIGNLANTLQVLSAGENQFSGTLPTELGSLINLQSLSMQQVITTGGIGGPMLSFRNLGQLTSLQLDSNRLTGPLPSDLLVNSRNLDGAFNIGLSDNRLDGTLPEQWARFDQLFVDLAGNKITGIGEGLCEKNRWMQGDVKDFGCDAILCPKGKRNGIGRQSDAVAPCEDCPSGTGNYFGAKSCDDDGGLSDGDSDLGSGDSELEILEEFFVKTNGVGWENSAGWIDSTDVCSKFYGVTCDGGDRVIKIQLVQNGLKGTVPTSIFKLPELREFYLSDNDITFSFNGIGNAERLEVLFLDNTNLDSIDGIGSAQSLRSLHIEDNVLTGEIPYELYFLTDLEELDAGYNQFSGKIPNIIGAMTGLTSLFMYHNQFTGRLPPALGDLTGLEELSLAENNFEGSIPDDFSQLTSLRFLSIQREGGIHGGDDIGINHGGTSVLGGGLTGTLPPFDSLTSLTQLYLGENSLTGEIPFNFLDGLDNKQAEVKVDLTSNRLSGTIPGSLTQFDNLSIYVADNQITDIADGICVKSDWFGGDVGSYSCDGVLCPVDTFNKFGRKTDDAPTCQDCPSGTNGFLGSFECLSEGGQQESAERVILEKLYKEMNGDEWIFSTNWMDPDVSICDWYGINCLAGDNPSVASIDLENNRLRHTFPTEIFLLPNLQELYLQGNAITFSFNGIENAANLSYLDLEASGLTSLDGIQKATSLKVLRIDENLLESFPTEIFDLTNLEVLSMSENQFPEAEMPTQFQNLANLVYLSCSNCGFTGPVPTWLGSLSKLEYIKLSQNALTGAMPIELESLVNLKHLDLSDLMTAGRGLSGEMLSFPNQTQLSELLLQYSGIEGAIPTALLQSYDNSERVTIDLRRNNLQGGLPVELGFIDDLNLYVAGNRIDELPDELCDKQWNGGNTATYTCDAILCDKGTFNSYGRAFGNLPCLDCPEGAFSDYYGSTWCGDQLEHNALILLYRFSDGANWKNDENWLRTDDHCTWYGITCHQDGEFKGLVKEIRLGDNNLGESLFFTTIWQMEGLEYVDMQKNDIAIPFGSIENARNLHTIILSETKTNSLQNIGGATALRSLHMTNAELTGPIPEELFQLSDLNELYLSHNDLTGTLSTNIGNMKKLADLYLFGNSLRGELPTELGFLASLKHISVGENYFGGTIPRQISSLPLLEVLSLQKEETADFDGDFAIGGGGFIGTIPAFDNLPRLTELYLGHNSLTGSIPEHFLKGIKNKSVPITVDLSYNSLGGSIPKSLADFDDMKIMLARNAIHGIPDEICAKTQWMDGEVENSCDAILCPPGTYNTFGRQVDSETPCDECTYPGSAVDYGSTECGPVFLEPMDDRSMLFELYDATGGSDWTNSASWDNDGVAFCDWYGITCEPVGEMGEMTVTEISLPGNNLHGIIPSVIFHLPELKKLDFRNNPVSIGFNAIHQAEKLEELYLDQTRVSSLSGIGKSTSLKILHLHKIPYGWKSIPEELYDVTTLTELNLSDSMFAGTLSAKIGNLNNLRSLALHGNGLSGQLPVEIGLLGALEDIELSNNNFFGTLPPTVIGMSSLKAFFLDNEKAESAGLSGQLPFFSNMPSLRELHLSDNQFTGTIPDEFLMDVDDLDSVINVYLDGNHIVGTIPSQLSAFNNLNIDLSNNLITAIGDGLCDKSGWLDGAVGKYDCNGILCPAGTFNPSGRQTSDESICDKCPGAETSPFMGATFCLSIQKQKEREILNKLFEATGGSDWNNKDRWTDPGFDICDWYGVSCREASTVESILLGSNNLVGTLPSEIFDLPNLEYLWLYSNPIEVSFTGIGKATNLRSLLLDATRVRSLDGIGAARSLVDLDVRFNQLTGPIPKEIENLENLQTFTCSDNSLTGTVPELTELRRLNALRMGNNQFTGILPSFALHPDIKSLDLSGNNLEGNIPSDIFEAADVEANILLDLSENSLTGTVPGELSRFEDLTIYLRDNKIEGVHPDLCSMAKWNKGDVGNFQCDGILCPSGTFSSSGRASRTGATCERCDKNTYFGGSICGKRSSATRFGGVTITILSIICLTTIEIVF